MSRVRRFRVVCAGGASAVNFFCKRSAEFHSSVDYCQPLDAHRARVYKFSQIKTLTPSLTFLWPVRMDIQQYQSALVNSANCCPSSVFTGGKQPNDECFLSFSPSASSYRSEEADQIVPDTVHSTSSPSQPAITTVGIRHQPYTSLSPNSTWSQIEVSLCLPPLSLFSCGSAVPRD